MPVSPGIATPLKRHSIEIGGEPETETMRLSVSPSQRSWLIGSTSIVGASSTSTTALSEVADPQAFVTITA